MHAAGGARHKQVAGRALDAALGKIQNVRNQKYVAEAKAALADATK